MGALANAMFVLGHATEDDWTGIRVRSETDEVLFGYRLNQGEREWAMIRLASMWEIAVPELEKLSTSEVEPEE
jgi:hypothetical protein